MTDLPSDQQNYRVLHGLECPYCGSQTAKVDSSTVYKGKSYGPIFICRACDAWVGIHKDGWHRGRALGRLADKELRLWKQSAHASFDPLWKTGGGKQKERTQAYSWLSKEMELPIHLTHIGMFNVDQCKHVVELCSVLVGVTAEPADIDPAGYP